MPGFAVYSSALLCWELWSDTCLESMTKEATAEISFACWMTFLDHLELEVSEAMPHSSMATPGMIRATTPPPPLPKRLWNTS